MLQVAAAAIGGLSAIAMSVAALVVATIAILEGIGTIKRIVKRLGHG